ncbi:MAG: MFS transporter [SAR202 cluster bacterium]|nr:MFS transporter [SAR202 cluster bacterium]|tara:strand:+ start:55293 stop:56540 length:1248 start_codon:yes stop_codon:yes gene_type:complete
MNRDLPDTTAQIFNKKERNLLIFTGLSHAICDAWHLIYPALLFLIAVDYNDFFFLGLIANIMIIFRGFAGVASGILADKYSSKLIYSGFAVLSALGCFLVYFSSNQIMLVCSFAVLGMGTGIYHPVGLSSITRFVKSKTRALGLHESAGCIGMGLIPILLTSIGLSFGWRYAFLTAGFISLIPLLLIPIIDEQYDKFQIPNANNQKISQQIKSVIKTFGDPLVLLTYAILIIGEASATGLDTFMPIAVAEIGGLKEGKVIGLSLTGLFVSLMVLAGVPGSIYGGILGSKIGIYKSLNLILAIQIPILILITITSGVWLLVLAPFVRLLTNMRSPLTNALISENIPLEMHGKGFAIMYGIAPIIGGLVALLGGAIAKFYGLNWVFPVIAILIALSFPMINASSRLSELKENKETTL